MAVFAWQLALSACSEDSAESATDPSGGASSGGAAAGGATSDVVHPQDLRVKFEEISLDGSPAHFTDFAFYPDSDEFLALDKGGRLARYALGETSATFISEARVAGVYDLLDCGAVSLAFEPGFVLGRYVYIGTCASGTHSEILRLDLDEDLNVVERSEVTILRVGDDAAPRPWHNVGSIGFEEDGVLWALFGEKVLGEPAQDPESHLGKLLRILPSREASLGGFEPAPGNPLTESGSEEVYALGLRSPFRGTKDSLGRYWIGDVGSDLFEEIDVVTEPAQDFGWPAFEGPCDDCLGTVPPAFAWGRRSTPEYIADDPDVETTLARVAWAGPEVVAHEPDRYRGALAGSVLFGDYCAGFVRHGRVDAEGVPTLDAPLGHLNNASSFRQHRDGYVYAVTFGRCQTDVENQADETVSRLYRMLPVD
jgi:glucose/arabinose dehydrogenase